MSKRYRTMPGVPIRIDDKEFQAAMAHVKSGWEEGDTLCFYDPVVVGEDDTDVILEVKWKMQTSGPSLIYDRSVGESLGRKIGREQTCVDCIFSAPCLGGSHMSFQRGLSGWLEDRVFARLGSDSSSLHGHLKDATAWEEVPDDCPGVPHAEDRVTQKAKASANDKPNMIILVGKEER